VLHWTLHLILLNDLIKTRCIGSASKRHIIGYQAFVLNDSSLNYAWILASVTDLLHEVQLWLEDSIRGFRIFQLIIAACLKLGNCRSTFGDVMMRQHHLYILHFFLKGCFS
jgi:hypothetical protein